MKSRTRVLMSCSAGESSSLRSKKSSIPVRYPRDAQPINARQMASAVLGALPLVFVFLLAQRQIVEGVAGTGLK
jgi:ABC-type glycerol-3-phosphate transport system permease component